MSLWAKLTVCEVSKFLPCWRVSQWPLLCQTVLPRSKISRWLNKGEINNGDDEWDFACLTSNGSIMRLVIRSTGYYSHFQSLGWRAGCVTLTQKSYCLQIMSVKDENIILVPEHTNNGRIVQQLKIPRATNTSLLRSEMAYASVSKWPV